MPRKKPVKQWNPSGKYANVTADQVCKQLDQLTKWAFVFKAKTGSGSKKLPKGFKPNGSGSPPTFP